MTPDRHRHRRGLLLTALVAAVVLAPLRPAAAAAADPGIQPRANVKSLLSHQVYGYLPYWRLNSGTAAQLDYDLVSTIAFFGLGIKATGDIDMAWRGTQAYLSARRDRRHERRPREGRPGRPDVPAVRLRRRCRR